MCRTAGGHGGRTDECGLQELIHLLGVIRIGVLQVDGALAVDDTELLLPLQATRFGANLIHRVQEFHAGGAHGDPLLVLGDRGVRCESDISCRLCRGIARGPSVPWVPRV